MIDAALPGMAAVLEEVRRIGIVSRRFALRAAAGGSHPAFRGPGIQVDDVREYVDGDDPRSVDWNVTARSGRLHVKRTIDEREHTVLFLLDVGPTMDAGTGPLSPRQVAARACAALALSAVRGQDRAGLVAFGSRVAAVVPPRRGARHALRLVRDGLVLRGGPGRSDLVPALELATRSFRRGAVLFLVSDFLSGGWRDALARCARRHDVIALRLLAEDAGLPAAGLFRVRDAGTGEERVLDAGHPSVRAAWAARARAWRERTAEDLRLAGAGVVDLPVPKVRVHDVVGRPLRTFFAVRARREGRR